MTSPAHEDRRALEREVLLAGLNPDPRRFELLAGEHATQLDWEWILERSRAHKVTPLLAGCIAETSLAAALPSSVVTSLDLSRRESSRRNHAATHTIQTVARCLDEAGVRFLVIRGLVLTDEIYRDSCRRSAGRIELVVNTEQVQIARDALRRLGYRSQQLDRLVGSSSNGEHPERALEVVARRVMPLLFRDIELTSSVSGLLPIELHWRIAPPARLNLKAPDVWNFTTPAVIAGTFVTTLDREATLIHLALQSMGRGPGGFRLLHVCDFAWALHRSDCDAERLVAVARAWGATSRLTRALLLVARLLELEALGQLPTRPAPWRWWFDRVMTRQALVDHHGAESVRQSNASDEIAWALAAGSLRSDWLERLGRQVARTALTLRVRGAEKHA